MIIGSRLLKRNERYFETKNRRNTRADTNHKGVYHAFIQQRTRNSDVVCVLFQIS